MPIQNNTSGTMFGYTPQQLTKSFQSSFNKDDPFSVEFEDLYTGGGFHVDNPTLQRVDVNNLPSVEERFTNKFGNQDLAPDFSQLQSQIIDPTTGQVKSSQMDILGQNAIRDLYGFAKSPGDSMAAQRQLEKQRLEERGLLDQMPSFFSQSLLQSQGNLARTGGLSGGARERGAFASAEQQARARQQTRLKGAALRAGIRSEDELRKLQALESVPQLATQVESQKITKLKLAADMEEAEARGRRDEARIYSSIIQSDISNQIAAINKNVDIANQEMINKMNLDISKEAERLGLSREKARFEANKIIARIMSNAYKEQLKSMESPEETDEEPTTISVTSDGSVPVPKPVDPNSELHQEKIGPAPSYLEGDVDLSMPTVGPQDVGTIGTAPHDYDDFTRSS
jgi:hypothetical protein